MLRTHRALRQADWLSADRALAYCRLFSAAVLIFGLAAQAGIFLPALADPHWRPIASDFDPFWSGARLALQGHPVLAYDMPAIRAVEASAAQTSGGLFYYLYPPVWMLLCLPFAALPYILALPAFLAAGYIAFVFSLRALVPRGWPLLPVIVFPAAILNATIGQNGFVTASCFAGAMLLLDRRPALAGACLGLLVFKPQLAIGIPLALLLAWRLRALAACAVMAVSLLAMSWLVLGAGAWRAFFAATPFIQSILWDPGIWPKLVSVFTGVRLLGGSRALAGAVQAASGAAGLVALGWVAWRRPGAGAEVATLVAAAMLCTPYLMDYDLVCLAVPMAWLVSRGVAAGWLGYEKIMLVLCFVLPLAARNGNLAIGVSVMPVALAALLCVIVARVKQEGKHRRLTGRQQNYAP